MKKFFIGLTLCVVGAIILYAAEPKVTRMGQSIILNTGGTTSTDGKTVVVTEDSSTNEYSFATITATVAGAVTASTNTFSTAYLATPVIVSAYKSGSTFTAAGLGQVTPTVSTTSLIVAGMNSDGSTNNLSFVIYGYKRAGEFQ